MSVSSKEGNVYLSINLINNMTLERMNLINIVVEIE